VLGKWLGTYRLVPMLAVLPALVIVPSVFFDVPRWLCVVLMVAYVLCAGAAITSLGLAMATCFSRPGRAVGATVAVYVLIAAGWMFLVMQLNQMGPRTEGLMMASPFFWAGNFTWELAHNPSRFEMHAEPAIFWTAAGAIAALWLLFVTLTSFDRRLGRVEGPFLALMHGQPTRGRRITMPWFLGVAAVATAAALLADGSLGSLINGALFSLGILIAAVTAATSCARQRQQGEFERARFGGLSPGQIVQAVWLGSFRLVVPMTLLTALVVLIHRQSDASLSLGVVSLLFYLLCLGAAWSGLGLALGLRFSARVAVFLTTAIYALGMYVPAAVSLLFFGNWKPNALWAGSPLLAVSTIGSQLGEGGASGRDAAWALVNWAQFYGVIALVLLAVAALTLKRRQKGKCGAAIGAADLF
jgi:hypothetical protein